MKTEKYLSGGVHGVGLNTSPEKIWQRPFQPKLFNLEFFQSGTLKCAGCTARCADVQSRATLQLPPSYLSEDPLLVPGSSSQPCWEL